MPAQFRQAAKLAWKDLRARRGRSALLVIALALSISGISGVRGAANGALDALRRGSRAPLAADVSIDTGDGITDEQYAALDALRKDGIDWTLVTIVLTMASSDESPDAAFVAVKAVDPRVYPFYGGANMAALLSGDGVIVSEDTLRRLHVRVGDPIRIAGRQFHITAVGKAEPEQILGILTRGLRCDISRENYEKSGIARGGNSSRNRILLRLPPGLDLRTIKRKLRPLIPGGAILDYQDVNQNIGLRIEGLAVFLNETVLLALALGSMGIAISIREHILQRLDIFAMMKMIGARNAQLAAIFLAEMALTIAAALPIGVALGWMLKTSLLSLARNFFVVPPVIGGNGVIFFEAAGAAILAMIPAAAEPVWILCRLRPASVVRREAPLIDSAGRTLIWTSATLLVVAFVAIAHHVLGSWNDAMVFSGGLLLGVVFSYGAARLSLWVIASAKSLPAAMRIGLGNLTRPGNHAALLIATISAGTMMMVATLESGFVAMRAVDARLPYDLSNSLLIAGFNDSHREQIVSFANGLKGVEKVEMKTEAGIRLVAVDGVALHTLGTRYVAGCSTEGLIIDRGVQRKTGAIAGSRLEFIAGNRRISATVASVVEESLSYPLQIDCSALDGANLFHQAIVRARPGKLFEVDEAVRNRFPTLAVITAPEIEKVIVEMSREGQRLAWIVASFWVAAGLCILMTLVAASRSQRLHETGILAALGATPGILARIYTIEFATIGAMAGIIGSAMACGLSAMLLGLMFHRWQIAFGWQVVLSAILTSTLLTTVAGWMPTYSLLRQKPMNVLREQ